MPKLEDINFSYQGHNLFQNLNLEIPEGQISCLLGPSGCGKTSLLNLISNLIKPKSGRIIGFPDSSFSYIFQETRILPWKTVYENISFTLHDKMSPEQVEEKTNKFMHLVELSDWKDHYPSKLSGGMKQRIAIARAFAFPSSTILMDEAFRGLDLGLKNKIFEVFLKSWKEEPRTVVFVTHDLEEALYLGNKLFLMSEAPVSNLMEYELDGIPGSERQIDPGLKKEIKAFLS